MWIINERDHFAQTPIYFFAVPKTATHAIREALRQHLGPDDWEQQVLFGKQSLPIPEIAKLNHGHITAREIQPHLDAGVWNSYFKFGFVRNPFDRFISTCFYLNRGSPNFANYAVSFMKQRLPVERFRKLVLMRPQSVQLVNGDGEIAMDYVGRYENLQHSYDTICEKIGIPTTALGLKNISKHAAFTDYYDDALKQMVAEYFADDLRIFAYDFPAD